MEAEPADWIAWDEVLRSPAVEPQHPGDDAADQREAGDRASLYVLELLQPLIKRQRGEYAEPRVPCWAFDLVRGLVARGYLPGSARTVLDWCAGGDPVERSRAVLSCFDLSASRAAVADLVLGRKAPTEEIGRRA